MKDNEDAFQALVQFILKELPTSFDNNQSDILSEFYALWQARSERRDLPTQSIGPTADVIGVRRTYSNDELELLEKNGINAFRSDGSIQMRQIMGPVIRLAMDRIKKGMADRSWAVVIATGGEICVPDVPAHGIIPITPSIVLHCKRAGTAPSDCAVEINRAMVTGARDYVFARSIACCPGVPAKN